MVQAFASSGAAIEKQRQTRLDTISVTQQKNNQRLQDILGNLEGFLSRVRGEVSLIPPITTISNVPEEAPPELPGVIGTLQNLSATQVRVLELLTERVTELDEIG